MKQVSRQGWPVIAITHVSRFPMKMKVLLIVAAVVATASPTCAEKFTAEQQALQYFRTIKFLFDQKAGTLSNGNSGTRGHEKIFTDEGLKHAKALPNLRHLHLNGTSITVGGLAELKGLKQLESINL